MDSDLDALCGVLARGLALDPDERFPSMAALADELEQIAGPAPEPVGSQPSGRMRRVSGEQRMVSGQHRALSTSQSSGTGSSSQNATTARTERPPRRTGAIIALVVLAAGAGAGGLYLAMRDKGGSEPPTQPPEPTPTSPEPIAPSKTSPVETTNERGEPTIPGNVDYAPGPTAPAPQAPAPKRQAKKTVTIPDDLGEPAPPPEDDPVMNGPGMAPTASSGTITLKDVNRAISRHDGKGCRAALAKLASPPPTDFRVASAHALCEMVAGNCEAGVREERALRVREGSNPDSADITADLYCSVNDPDPAVRLRRLSRQLSMFTWFECSYYLPAARASGKAVSNDRERMQVGSALATIAKCYSDREDCPTARKVLTEAQAFIPALGVSELNAACR